MTFRVEHDGKLLQVDARNDGGASILLGSPPLYSSIILTPDQVAQLLRELPPQGPGQIDIYDVLEVNQ